jgi:hypothetical protein
MNKDVIREKIEYAIEAHTTLQLISKGKEDLLENDKNIIDQILQIVEEEYKQGVKDENKRIAKEIVKQISK